MTSERQAELVKWMTRHEQDIYRERNDYGDLKKVFAEVVGHDAGIPVENVEARNERIENSQAAQPLAGDPIFPPDV